MTLRIRDKVILPALAVIVVLAVPAAYSVLSVMEINRQTDRLRDFDFPSTLSTRRMERQLRDVIELGRAAGVSGEPSQLLQKLEEIRRALDAELDGLMVREPLGAAREQQREFRRAVESLYNVLQRASPEDDPEEASTIKWARDSLAGLERHYTREVEKGIGQVAQLANRTARFTLWSLLAALLVSGIVWVAILLSLSRPLRELVSGTERVSRGRFDEPIPVLASDELGTLSVAFNRMAAGLSELDRMKAEFVATASHELKTPLACIKGFASLLRSGSRGPLSDEQRATLHQIEEQVDQMTNFVGQLLDLSRLRAGRVNMKVRSLPAEAFFSSVARGFEGMADRKGIRYQVRLSGDLPQRIQVDPDRMREVVYNLLGNAFKFTERGGEVGFVAEPEADGEWVRVTVSDTGPGIPQEELPFIFEKYYRGADPDEARGNEGAGLGLAISRGIVEKHGGRIWVENRAKRGSRFVFRIPATFAAVEEPRAGQQVVPGKES